MTKLPNWMLSNAISPAGQLFLLVILQNLRFLNVTNSAIITFFHSSTRLCLARIKSTTRSDLSEAGGQYCLFDVYNIHCIWWRHQKATFYLQCCNGNKHSSLSLSLPLSISLSLLLCWQETLIVWAEDDAYDLALSFKQQEGCNEVWARICEVSL